MNKFISRLHFTEVQPKLLLPQTSREASRLDDVKLAEALPHLPEKLVRELVVLTRNPARLQLIMRKTTNADVRQALIKHFRLGLTINGVSLDLETKAARAKAVKEQVIRVAMLFPEAGNLIGNTELAQAIFERLIPFTVTSDVQIESLNRKDEVMEWSKQFTTGLFPPLKGKYLPPLFFHGRTAIPNLTMLADKQNILAYDLDKNLELLSGDATAWFYSGAWQSWGYARNGYWVNPRPTIYFRGERFAVASFLFGGHYQNRRDQQDKLNLNPFHWVKAEYGDSKR